ncbi:glycosyltransferase [Lactococcus protaetiae]|uniref:Glycosyltransferase n=1 Tax=Lactococcus protaetiae TaxID=2592653 RepID=A0A514Z7E2_9LACT|nr:glycosyltransferase [Lactococcus protaetiae]QDK70473.1 glycosyltransferase [Lactococcus protaetiae]
MNLTICMVAYSKKFTDTTSFNQLNNFDSSVKKQLNLIIFDNGIENFTDEKLPDDFASVSYQFNTDKNERGTRIAYQYALTNMHDSWLMLLDDDTLLTENYVKDLLTEMSTAVVDAFCPQIFDEKIQISPTDSETIENLYFPKKPGIYTENITGISSGLVLSKKFMTEIDGFTKEFPLDYLDHWIFWQLRQHKKRIKIIDEKIQHQLSVQHLTGLSKERFAKIFTAEYHYYQHYQPEQLYSIRKKYGKMMVKGWLKGNIFLAKTFLKILLGKK